MTDKQPPPIEPMKQDQPSWFPRLLALLPLKSKAFWAGLVLGLLIGAGGTAGLAPKWLLHSAIQAAIDSGQVPPGEAADKLKGLLSQ